MTLLAPESENKELEVGHRVSRITFYSTLCGWTQKTTNSEDSIQAFV